MNILKTHIETERLILIPVSAMYREEIFSEFTPEITTYMFPKSADDIGETDAFIAESIENMSKGTELVCVILKKDTKEFMGIAGLHHIDTPTPEFGIWTKKSSHGNKYGREAIYGVKQWADKNIVYEYITYPADKRNIGSKKIAESLGGVIKKEYTQTGLDGQELDEVEYWIYPMDRK